MYVYIYNLVIFCELIGLSILNLAGRGPHGLWVFKEKNILHEVPHVMWKTTHQGQYEDETLIGWNDLSVIGQSMKQVWMWPFIAPSYELECQITPSIKVWLQTIDF